MNYRSKWIQVDFVKGSRTIANSFWACLLVCGATGFLPVGFSSCVGKDLTPGLSSEHIVFIPQGIVMCFYGIAGLFIGLYLWCTAFRNVGGGYNLFDKREGFLSIFRWGFPGNNRRICIRLVLKDVEAIGLESREGLYPRRLIYLKMRGRQNIPLTRIGESLTLGDMEEKAAEPARFPRVSIEGF
uniref:photosystem I assembly protein Ycf4 n=1 Tax=Bolbitis deltigera TaxID=2605327 RepID=UPI0023AA8C46|nr:photosystem I assembly protein Ycf4 [Bolbitis deltigera]WCO87017.1 photosystem I assembly protein Ycf4 [Bolbitis deltigera]